MGGVKASVCGASGTQRHHAQMFAEHLVAREMEVMKLRAVVVTDEARALLKMFRLELDDRGRAEAMRLLPSRHQ
jgi:hypothetical protein